MMGALYIPGRMAESLACMAGGCIGTDPARAGRPLAEKP
jgi:hypothetical protein